MAINKFYKINQYNSSIHIYRGVLVIGDAYEMISEIKKGDAYFNFFYDDKKTEEYINPIDKLDEFKTYRVFSLNHHGGCWTPIFNSEREGQFTDAYFIDTASAHLHHSWWKPETCGSKEHLKLLNQMIEKSLDKYHKSPVDKKTLKRKVWGSIEISIPSGKILFMGASNEVPFTTKGEEIKIDYKTKTKEEIFEQLHKLCFEPKCKFVNFQTPFDEYTFDFHVDNLSFKGHSSHLIYKIESLVEDIDWFATYYAKYYIEEKDIHKKQKPTKKEVEEVKKWSDEQSERYGLKPRSFKEHEERMSEPLIERYKYYIKRFGFTHGYYLVREDILDNYL